MKRFQATKSAKNAKSSMQSPSRGGGPAKRGGPGNRHNKPLVAGKNRAEVGDDDDADADEDANGSGNDSVDGSIKTKSVDAEGEEGSIRVGAMIEYCFEADESKPDRKKYKWWQTEILAPQSIKPTPTQENWWKVRFFEDDGRLAPGQPLLLKISKDNFNMAKNAPLGGWCFQEGLENRIMKSNGGRMKAKK